MLQVALNQEV